MNRKSKKIKAPRARRATAKPTPATRAQEMLRGTVDALAVAEQELTRQVRGLLERNKIDVDDAGRMLKRFRARLDKERRRGAKELDARLAALQARLQKERRNVARLAAEGVQSALAALNIPSRREVTELTRKVEQLSKKIDRLRRK